LKLINSDCISAMKEMPENSVDSIVTDPPYELGFMGKSWDSSGIAFNIEVWQEALRVLKPGGHLIAFSGSRTYHRMAVAIEDAGFEIRDQIMWVYGSGFPKSHNVSKGIDKAAGAVREVTEYISTPYKINSGSTNAEYSQFHSETMDENGYRTTPITAPATPAAKQWDGWGTALKPAHEPMVLARKPLIGTVANNVLTYGTGGLNIDASRVGTTVETWPSSRSYAAGQMQPGGQGETQATGNAPAGRWPANFIHDGSDEVNDLLGEPSRFFYCAKASKRDRNEGLDGFEVKQTLGGGGLTEVGGAYGSIKAAGQNHHPTVKPTTLMQYLVRLVTPPNGIVLDPFMGSGSTGKAAMLEGFDFIGIEQDSNYIKIAEARIEYTRGQSEQQLF
jgi:site-specific DNA-methyltransferase (adenine-specific)